LAHVSHKLSNFFEGALAGGGDPATSPLYVFGPFLKLIVVAGVAQVTFGVSIWLAVLTAAMVSAMYRLVMAWVVDGSGGSGLSEEEFGSWAVKVNAGITFIEYTLTFLVSVAALVTFTADRVPYLNQGVPGLQYRTLLAVLLSFFIGWIGNRGPRIAARAFGPATLAVLVLLWVMIFFSVWRFGFRLPGFNLEVQTINKSGQIAHQINELSREIHADLIVMSTHGMPGLDRLYAGDVPNKLIPILSAPLLLLRPTERWQSRTSRFKKLLVCLDGSETAERVIRYARALARTFGSEIVLLSIPESESEFGRLNEYLQQVEQALRERGYQARGLVTGSGVVRTILDISASEEADLVMMTTHGRGRMERHASIGSVTDLVVDGANSPVFLVPA
jgi:nucleotide-binding universal stress UspA family protein